MSIGWFGFTLEEAERCTMRKFSIYAKARRVKRESEREMMAYQAWMIQQVKATKKSGKNYVSLYDSFSDFYDHDKEFEAIFSPKIQKNKQRKMDAADINRLF